MVRASGTTDRLGPTVAGGRLDALGLGARPRGGWVPEAFDAAVPPPVEPRAAAELPGSALPAQSPPTPGIERLAKDWAADRLPPWSHGVIDRLGAGGVVVGLVVLAIVAMLGVSLLRHPSSGATGSSYGASMSDPSDLSGPVDPVATPVATSGASSTSIVVDVGGRVHKPGLVTLPDGARVADAIAAAGGPLHHREIATLDLAARVSDGQLLLIGVSGTAAGPGSAAATGDSSGGAAGGTPAPVDLNSATIDQLETLPGVGPATAQKIIDWRTSNNGFVNIEQLQQVPGIGPVKYSELAALVTP